MQELKVFLASSSELADDRLRFSKLIVQRNNALHVHGVYLRLIAWEDFLDTMSRTRLLDEYHRAIRECDLFVLLYRSKVGPYTAEEFENAFKQFQTTDKPRILIYFNDVEIALSSIDPQAMLSLWAFKAKLKELGHFQTEYKTFDGLAAHFARQLEKLHEEGFIRSAGTSPPATTGGGVHADNGSAIAQGANSIAAAKGALVITGNNTGTIVHRDVHITHGDFVGRDKVTSTHHTAELVPLLAALRTLVAPLAPAEQKLDELAREIEKGNAADDGAMARIVDGLIKLVPAAIGSVVSLFATPVLSALAGPATRLVLDKLQGR